MPEGDREMGKCTDRGLGKREKGVQDPRAPALAKHLRASFDPPTGVRNRVPRRRAMGAVRWGRGRVSALRIRRHCAELRGGRASLPLFLPLPRPLWASFTPLGRELLLPAVTIATAATRWEPSLRTRPGALLDSLGFCLLPPAETGENHGFHLHHLSLNALYPQIHVLKPSPPAPQNGTIFGDKALKEVIIKLKMRPLRWALLQPNRCPYKKRSLRPTEKHQGCACAEEKGHMRTQQGGSHLTSQGQRPQGKPTA
ncbi:uncharacterized protein LOC125136547 [Phacochoerus africanus]|uniref:uncharacterized protein LOC125136547 n=1 Tax=Phacochoerus africanus TaxID=41426 RepID=UPI001FD9F5D6|nr:uncharacterized protein LOC125136547 [Phacochoerus africanus]